ncbi:MAG: 3-deoxy-D-manno-octulosonic acid transferase [Bacteroidota bacterium]
MNLLFYRLFLWLYQVGIHIAALFSDKAKKFINGRKGWKKLIESKSEEIAGCIWFHCASLGEFEQGRPLIESIREIYPDSKILLTFFSPSGYEIRKNYTGADLVMYLPMDSPRNAKHFIQLTSPKAAFFVKYEYWFHYLKELHESNVPTYMVSAVFRQNHIFFKWYGSLHRRMLGFIKMFFVQDASSSEMLKNIGYSNATVSGDTRFDRVLSGAHSANPLAKFESLRGNGPVLVAGSTWPEDEKLLTGIEEYHSGKLKMVIVPHEISEDHINKLMDTLGKGAARYSNWEGDFNTTNSLVVDTIGMLSSIYQYADIAYVGGGFGSGIHNTLEAVAFGAPVVFGPNFHRFNEANALIEIGGGFSIKNINELQSKISELLSSKSDLEKIGEINRGFIMRNSGATNRILKHLKEK